MAEFRLWWYRNDCSLWRNPKTTRLMSERNGDRALIVWQALIAYSVEWDLNGVVPKAELSSASTVARAAHMRLLVAHAFISDSGDAWTIHDYDSYQKDTDKARQFSRAGKTGADHRWAAVRRANVHPIREDD